MFLLITRNNISLNQLIKSILGQLIGSIKIKEIVHVPFQYYQAIELLKIELHICIFLYKKSLIINTDNDFLIQKSIINKYIWRNGNGNNLYLYIFTVIRLLTIERENNKVFFIILSIKTYIVNKEDVEVTLA